MKTKTMSCYCIELRTTGPLRDTANLANDAAEAHYIDVEDGVLYAIGRDATEIAAAFPHAIRITRLGIGYVLGTLQCPAQR